MKEIKFRFYDTFKKEMTYDYDNDGCSWFDVNPYQPMKNIGTLISMQYTGLKDTNDKEIYEGDIVQRKYTDYNLMDEYEIATNTAIDISDYDNENFMRKFEIMKTDIVTMDRFPRFWLENEGFGYEGEDLVSPDDCTVIGNVYENPELLEKGE